MSEREYLIAKAMKTTIGYPKKMSRTTIGYPDGSKVIHQTDEDAKARVKRLLWRKKWKMKQRQAGG